MTDRGRMVGEPELRSFGEERQEALRILGIDRFMSMFRGLVNMIGNGVATLVVARWEKEIGSESLKNTLA